MLELKRIGVHYLLHTISLKPLYSHKCYLIFTTFPCNTQQYRLLAVQITVWSAYSLLRNRWEMDTSDFLPGNISCGVIQNTLQQYLIEMFVALTFVNFFIFR